MYYSLFDVFSIGIGPSSSHKVGPMRAGLRFVKMLTDTNLLVKTTRIQVVLYGSLALTGVGHGTPNAVVYGLLGLEADTIDMSVNHIGLVQSSQQICLNQIKNIPFNMDKDIVIYGDDGNVTLDFLNK